MGAVLVEVGSGRCSGGSGGSVGGGKFLLQVPAFHAKSSTVQGVHILLFYIIFYLYFIFIILLFILFYTVFYNQFIFFYTVFYHQFILFYTLYFTLAEMLKIKMLPAQGF
jgi:hypothetical protein